MRKPACALSLAVLLGLAAPASGASIDLQNARCKDIMTLHEDDAVLLYFWLDGYLYRERELPILNLDAAAQAITHMAGYCAANPDAPLRDALQPPGPPEEAAKAGQTEQPGPAKGPAKAPEPAAKAAQSE